VWTAAAGADGDAPNETHFARVVLAAVQHEPRTPDMLG
jgi:hypothetical protein